MKTRLAAVSAAIALTGVIAGCGSSTSSAPAASGATDAATIAPIGTATMEVQGTGTATVKYKINGDDEVVEQNVPLPWSKVYDVVPKLSTSVTADGAGASGCTIMMDGKLAAYVTQPNPTCTFAYY